jgi:hypothetical protein
LVSPTVIVLPGVAVIGTHKLFIKLGACIKNIFSVIIVAVLY